MAFNVSNSLNSASVSGQLGLQRASQGITEASVNIAQRNGQAQDPQSLLTETATDQPGVAKQSIPRGTDSLTTDLVSLNVNALNAQASAKVLDVASNTVGRIIDEIA